MSDLSFPVSVLAKKDKTILCRIFDPNQCKWWTGTDWTPDESSAIRYALNEIELLNPYEDRYATSIPVPCGGTFTIEYIDADGNNIIAEESTAEALIKRNADSLRSDISPSRLALVDTLTRLDVPVSTRAPQVSIEEVIDRLTAIDIAIASISEQIASIDASRMDDLASSLATITSRLTLARVAMLENLRYLDTYVSNAVENRTYIPVVDPSNVVSNVGGSSISYGDGTQVIIQS